MAWIQEFISRLIHVIYIDLDNIDEMEIEILNFFATANVVYVYVCVCARARARARVCVYIHIYTRTHVISHYFI